MYSELNVFKVWLLTDSGPVKAKLVLTVSPSASIVIIFFILIFFRVCVVIVVCNISDAQ